MTMHRPSMLCVATVLSLLGCSATPASTVTIDVSALRAQTALEGPTLDRLGIIVTGPEIAAPITMKVDSDDTFTADIPSGPARLFTLDAVRLLDDPAIEVPAFIGSATYDLPAGGVVEVVLPAFRAGLLRGDIEALFGGTLPESLALTLVPQEPPVGWPDETSFEARGPRISLPLPVGAYDVTGSFVEASDTFGVPQGKSISIAHAEVTETSVYLVRDRDKCRAGSPAEVLVAAPTCREVRVQATGIAAGALVLAMGGESLSFTEDGTQSFADEVADGSTYEVTITTLPASATCVLLNATGTAAGAPIDVTVQCSPLFYPVRVQVAGLGNNSVTLHNNGESLSLSADGTYAFVTAAPTGTSYAVTADAMASGNCVVINGAGLATAPILVQVRCVSDVRPLYDNAKLWNDYVVNDAARPYDRSAAACTAATAGLYDACIHGGERRAVDLWDVTSCTGVTAQDEQQRFDWTCDSSTGHAVVLSTGLKRSMLLAHLLTASPLGFAANTLSVFDGFHMRVTAPRPWWTNRVVPLSSVPATDNEILVATADAATSVIINSGGMRPAVVAMPGATLTGATVVAIYNRPFSWVEGSFVSTATSGPSILLSGSPRSVIRGLRVNAASGGDTGISVVASPRSIVAESEASSAGTCISISIDSPAVTLQSVMARNCRADGILIDGAGSVIRDSNAVANGGQGINVRVNGVMIISTRATNNVANGILLSPQSPPLSYGLLVDIMAANNRQTGVALSQANDVAAAGLTLVNNANMGLWLSNAYGTFVANVLSANSNAGVSVDWGNHNTLLNIAAVNNMTGITTNYAYQASFINAAVLANDIGISTGFPGANSDAPRFRGRLFVGGPGEWCADSYENTVVSGTCTVEGTEGSSTYRPGSPSDAVLGVDRVVGAPTPAFVDAVTVDRNKVTTTGVAVADDIINQGARAWIDFDSFYRSWIHSAATPPAFPDAAHRGACIGGNGGSCQIFDWRVRVNRALTSIVPPTGATFTRMRADGKNTDIGLLGAVEIIGDGVGDDDLVCETTEDCIVTSNIASFQGWDPNQPVTPEAAGTIGGARLFIYRPSAIQVP